MPRKEFEHAIKWTSLEGPRLRLRGNLVGCWVLKVKNALNKSLFYDENILMYNQQTDWIHLAYY
jgi:hypothetical protein